MRRNFSPPHFPTLGNPLASTLRDDHRLRPGLCAAFTPNHLARAYNHADGQWYGNQNAATALNPTRDGHRISKGFLSEQPKQNSGTLLRRPSVTNECTIFVVANLAGNAGASKSCFFGVWPKSTDASPWSGFSMTQDDWLLVFWYNNGGGEGSVGVDCNLDQSAQHNRVITLAVAAKSGDQRFFRDASKRGTTTATWSALGASFGSDWCFGIGRAPRGDETNTNAIMLAYMWDRALRDEEIVQLHARPYDLFVPRSARTRRTQFAGTSPPPPPPPANRNNLLPLLGVGD